MSSNPRCANCLEEIPWIPVYEDREVYCCDGCAMGGPCVCTYEGLPPKLNTRGILAAAGYDPDAWASDLTVCANCFEEFRRPPAYSDSSAYCCQGCMRGGPCAYSDDSGPQAIDVSAGRNEDEQPQKVNPLWSLRNGHSREDEAAGEWWLIKANPLWHVNGSASEPQQDLLADIEKLDLDAEMEDESAYESCRVLVSPLPEVADVRRFMAQFERLPSVQSVLLTHYGGDCATYDVQTDAIRRVIKDLIAAEVFPIRNFNLTHDGLELVLERSKGALTPSVPDGAGLRNGYTRQQSPSKNGAAAHLDDGAELHPFKYEIGVDVFFKGRHQVEIGGVKGPVHMHSWRVQAILDGESISESGSAVGTQDAREIITELVTGYNEKLLNRMPPFDEIMPTSNNIARVIYEHMSRRLEGGEMALKSVRLWESPTSYVEYVGD